MKYSEKRTDSKKYKEEYQIGINDLIKRRNEEAGKVREEYIKNVFAKPEKYRKDLEKILGWPLGDGKPFDGGHEFCRDDMPIERLISDLDS